MAESNISELPITKNTQEAIPPTESTVKPIPGELRVISRTGNLREFDANRIRVAIEAAFTDVAEQNCLPRTKDLIEQLHHKAEEFTKTVTGILHRRYLENGVVHIEDIQDQVELALMRQEEHDVAKEYVLYRQRRQEQRAEQAKHTAEPAIQVTLGDGSKTELDLAHLQTIIDEACYNILDVDSKIILEETKRNLFQGVTLRDVNKALVMTARTLIEEEPNYTYVSSRLLLNNLRSEALPFLGLQESTSCKQMISLYGDYFRLYLQKGVESELLDPVLLSFDLEKIIKALKPNRDLQFTYLGLQTLYDRYFIHVNETRIELPQAFFMRVAMGLAVNEKDKTAKAIEFYNLLSSFDYMSSTPTLFNSGTLKPQLSSCFLTTIDDDLRQIYDGIRDNALLSKFAGGLGNDWTRVRAMGARIKGTNGKSQGVVPFLKVANDTAIAVNQGGKRKGAVCAYLETWHLDIEEFLDLRKNTGDDRRRTHDMNTANWVPDLFMKRVFEKGVWTLFSPEETPDLHDLYGKEFEKAYMAYEAKAAQGKMAQFKEIPAVNLWRKMLGMLFETGHPWLTFKDPCNLRSPQQHTGVIHSSNLCTEITLNTSNDEIAVCNLGSVNLPQHIIDGKLDERKLQKTIKTAIRMLDNVIDINFYTVPQARQSNLKHRPIGLGIMGFQDALYRLGIAYSSDEAVKFADRSMELVSYSAILASSKLAEERGSYESFEGSLWSQGILPIDSIHKLQDARGDYLEQDGSSTLDWDALRKQVQTKGMRNSNTMAIAPTATISNICGVSQSIEPTYQNLFVKSNMSGEFTVVNPYLVAELKQRGLWDKVMANDLKYHDGSVQPISRVPDELKVLFATAFEIEPRWLVDAASRRQKWIDQAQSLNLYMKEPSGKKLDILYRMAWIRGLKTTYYLRSMSATNVEKSTLADGALNAVQPTAPKACAIDDPDCDACQ